MTTPAYQENETGLMSIRTESGLYMVYPNSGKSADIVSFLMDDSNNYTGFAKMSIAPVTNKKTLWLDKIPNAAPGLSTYVK